MDATNPQEPRLKLQAAYANGNRRMLPGELRLGEGMVGQCALEKKRIVVSKVPANYLKIASGLGEATPMTIIILPVLFEGQVKAVIELASFGQFSATHEAFLDELTESIGIVLHTIEANMRTEELLKQSQSLFAEAQEASRSKSAFLSMAAHELRTPISVVLGYVSMLEDGTLGPAPSPWKRPVEVLGVKAKELNKLVDDLLLAARVEGGTVPTKVLPLDLRKLAEDAVGRAEARATLLEAEMSLQLPPQRVLVEADPDHVARILDNLINNALTYSIEKPRVLISVSNHGDPQVAIEDRGIGIRADMQEPIFERFFRLDDSAFGTPPGTGLGLYIARGLAERHGGSLRLDWSEPGAGSKFVLRLPAGSGRLLTEGLTPAVARTSDGGSRQAPGR